MSLVTDKKTLNLDAGGAFRTFGLQTSTPALKAAVIGMTFCT